MKKLLIIFGLVILSLLIIAVLGVGYLGFVPGLSSLMGTNKPRDLGVRFTEKDLHSAQEKLGQKVVKSVSSEQLSENDGHSVETTLTQEEYTAHAQQIHPVSDLQIKLDGSSFEISGRIDRSRIPAFVRTWGLANASDTETLNFVDKYLPADPIFYIAGNGSVKNNDLTTNLTRAELGRLPVAREQAREIVELYTETLFLQIPGFSVEESGPKDGQLYFKGTAADQIPKY